MWTAGVPVMPSTAGSKAARRPAAPRHRIRVAAAIERRARVGEIDAVERGREPIRVALAPDLAIADDVEARGLLHPDRDERRVVLRFGEIRLCHPPQLAGSDPRRKPLREAGALDQ